MAEVPANAHLLMDRGLPLGNSEDVFTRRALHVKVGNTALEPIPIVGTVMDATGFSSGTPVEIAVSSTSSLILPANALRKYARFSNFSAETVWLQYNLAASVGRGIRLKPGSVWTIGAMELWLGDIFAVSSGATVNIDTMEGT